MDTAYESELLNQALAKIASLEAKLGISLATSPGIQEVRSISLERHAQGISWKVTAPSIEEVCAMFSACQERFGDMPGYSKKTPQVSEETGQSSTQSPRSTSAEVARAIAIRKALSHRKGG